MAKALRIAFRLSALEPLLVAALALTLLTSCIGSAPQNAKADANLTEAEVEYVENNHSACVKVLDDFARLTESQIVEIKYYQRGANEFAVSAILAEQFEGETLYSGASCIVNALGETMLAVRGATLEKVDIGHLRRW